MEQRFMTLEVYTKEEESLRNACETTNQIAAVERRCIFPKSRLTTEAVEGASLAPVGGSVISISLAWVEDA